MISNIHLVDLSIVVVYLGLVLIWGVWLGRGQQNTEDFFLGGRAIPWWVVLFSIVATETSTVTFLSIPGCTFVQENGDYRFLQITFGYIIGRILVSAFILPLYFQGKLFTCYEVLETRFGPEARRATSLLFLVTRNLSDALRLYLTAIVLQLVTGFDLTFCVIAIGTVTIIYTFVGGAKSVVWNDSLQFIIYLFGGIASLIVIVNQLPEGLDQLMQFSREFDKGRLFDFELSLTKPTMTFWAGLFGGMFLTAATHGTDQLMVQRYLSARSERSAKWAISLSGIIVFLQFALFLTIGLGLACYYREIPSDTTFTDADRDRVFAHFIVNHLGVGLVGLTLAAVFAAAMSTLSSSLHSSATALINDLYLPMKQSSLSAQGQLWVSRVGTASFGVLQIVIAIAAHEFGATEDIVKSVLKIASFALGPILGLYLLGIATRQVRQKAALLGFFSGIATLTSIALTTRLYWPWYAGCGAISVLILGLLYHALGFDRSVTEDETT